MGGSDPGIPGEEIGSLKEREDGWLLELADDPIVSVMNRVGLSLVENACKIERVSQ